MSVILFNMSELYDEAALRGGFKVIDDPDNLKTPSEYQAIGKKILPNLGLTDRQTVSLQYAIHTGKATLELIHELLGMIYHIDSLRAMLLQEHSPDRREAIRRVISILRYNITLPNVPYASLTAEQKATRNLYTKLLKIMHPKPRSRRAKALRTYALDQDTPYKRGIWSHYVPVGTYIRNPDKRKAFKDRLEKIKSSGALAEWRAYYKRNKGLGRSLRPSARVQLDALGPDGAKREYSPPELLEPGWVGPGEDGKLAVKKEPYEFNEYAGEMRA